MFALSHLALIEHHDPARHVLQRQLSGDPRFEVVAVAAEPTELPDPAHQRFDVIVYGAQLPTGAAFAATVRRLSCSGRVLIVADLATRQQVTQALAVGAFGCVGRQEDAEVLSRAVETVTHGCLHVAPGLATCFHTERQPAPEPVPELTPREQEALLWLATGLTHGQIARRMGLTESTISTYVKRIRGKLNVGNKAELTRKAIELGLLSEETGSGPDSSHQAAHPPSDARNPPAAPAPRPSAYPRAPRPA